MKSLISGILSLFMVSFIFAAPPELMQDLRWRLVGPLRAGWSTCAEGIPDEPDTFYFGAADGGVWKTTDAGNTWQSIADSAPFSSVETMAISGGPKRVIYVGTGQTSTRYDIMEGNGVFKTEDDGKTWKSLGLADTLHIGRILVNPTDPNVVLVAALGHVFGPNAERGVFRSTDGGERWTKVLFADENTGAVDLASDPAYPNIIYAATWQLRLRPWLSYFEPQVGPGSGIWKSTDGGQTWKQTSRNGIPPGLLGRIGLAVAPQTNGQRIYAAIMVGEKGGLFRSDDGGDSWKLVNKDSTIPSTYFGRLTPDPANPDVLYVPGVHSRRSTDGGQTFVSVKGAPGGDDYHFYWINPKHPDHSVYASDQGTTVSVNGGLTWTPWYNQATGQFYRISTDNQFPYWIYSGQQDTGTVGTASRSDYGQLTFRDWHPVGGDERDYDLPDPDNPGIIFGSGLGGRLSRWDSTTGRVTNVAPWPASAYALLPTAIKYRYTWFTPIAFSPRPDHALYLGAQVLFRSLDKGKSWEIISPDLSGAEAKGSKCPDTVTTQQATACGYGVIYTINPSPLQDGLIWVGTDNGRVQLTRDSGKTWTNVAPPAVQDWSKISSIDASSIDPGTAYISVDRYRMDDRAPYIYRTHDFGKTWTPIVTGLPDGSWVNVVRQDPAQSKLLYAGTRTGVFVSFDDGDHWQTLQLNLPRTAVNDLQIHGDDLVIGTQGRAIWILDNASPLRHVTEMAAASAPMLLPPAPAFRISRNENRDTPLPPEFPRTQNPPVGAVLDYFLPNASAQQVVFEIVNEQGEILSTFRSNDKPQTLNATMRFPSFWVPPAATVTTKAGLNRFIWDLRLPRPKSSEYDVSIAAVPGVDITLLPQGIPVLPGKYTVRLTADGKTSTQPLMVKSDPRVSVKLEDMQAQLSFYSEVGKVLAEVSEKYDVLQARDETLKKLAEGKEALDAKKEQDQMAPLLAESGDISLAVVFTDLRSLAEDLESAEGPPTPAQRALLEDCRRRMTAIEPLLKTKKK